MDTVERIFGLKVDIAHEMSEVPANGCLPGADGTVEQIGERALAYAEVVSRIIQAGTTDNDRRPLVRRVILAGSVSAPFMLAVAMSFPFPKNMQVDLYHVHP